jgi:hypothetical protein
VTNQLLASVISILIAGCALQPNKSAANLTYQGFHRVTGDLYSIRYLSDLDLLNIFSRADGNGQLSTMLVCSLEGDPVFTPEHVIEKTFEGVIGITGKTPGPPYQFNTEGTFNLSYNNGGSSTFLKSPQIYSILRQNKTITCKASITVFGYKGYYSNPMLIPSADIILELDKPYNREAK